MHRHSWQQAHDVWVNIFHKGVSPDSDMNNMNLNRLNLWLSNQQQRLHRTAYGALKPITNQLVNKFRFQPCSQTFPSSHHLSLRRFRLSRAVCSHGICRRMLRKALSWTNRLELERQLPLPSRLRQCPTLKHGRTAFNRAHPTQRWLG